MRNLRRGTFLVAVLLLFALPARATWEPGGIAIGKGYGFRVVTSGPDRAILAWLARLPDRYEIRAQAWTSAGDIAPGWPAGGVLLAGDTTFSGNFELTGDSEGGAFVAWTNGRLAETYLQHVSASGSRAAGWPEDGVELESGYPRALASDGRGGVLAGLLVIHGQVADVVVHDFDASGSPAPDWPAEGVRFRRAGGVAMLADGADHVIVSTTEFDTTTYKPLGVFVRRLDRNGEPDPAWTQGGVVLTEPKYAYELNLFPDGAGGVFAEWLRNTNCDYFCAYDPRASAARILGAGSPAGGWAPAPTGNSFALDGAGGMLIGLRHDGRPSVLRMDANGSVSPGFDPEGSHAMTEVVRPTDVMVTGDGAGGAYAAWWDLRGGDYHLYASRVDATGHLAAGWPETGTVIGPRTQSRYLESSMHVQLASLDNGVAVAVWSEFPGARGYIAALRPGEPGPVADLTTVDRSVGFGVVQLRSNPVTGPIVAVVELPSAGPAQLELLDAAGRRLDVRHFDFAQQARGTIRLAGTGAHPAGIYWLRLTQGGRVMSKKVILLE